MDSGESADSAERKDEHHGCGEPGMQMAFG